MSEQHTKVKGVVDIVFLIDVSGSMAHCIEALKENIKSFVKTLTSGDGGPNEAGPAVKDFRIKVAAYRDVIADHEWFVEHPFTASVDDVHGHLATLVASGGGDEPESLLDGLHKISNMGQTDAGAPADPSRWRYRREAARVVVVFTDASFHKTMSYPEGKGGGVADVMNAAMQSRIMLEIFAPDMECFVDLEAIDKANFNRIAYDVSAKNGAVIALEQYTRDKANFSKVMAALAKSVSKSAEVPVL